MVGIGDLFSALFGGNQHVTITLNEPIQNEQNNNVAPKVEAAPVVEQPKVQEQKVEQPKKPEEINEFLTIARDFVLIDLKNFTEKYPLVSTIATIAFGFFALMHVFSFSPVSIVTGLFLGTLCVSLAKSTWNVYGLGIFGRIFARARVAFSSNPPQPAPEQPAPAAAQGEAPPKQAQVVDGIKV